MTDNFTVFWQNNARAYELFADLLSRAERNAYDDDFLVRLAAYREESPESERADIFAARYLLHHGDAEGAAVCGERAYQKRPVNYEVWKVLAEAYGACGRALESITMQGYSCGLYNTPEKLSLHLTEDTLQEGLGRLSLAIGLGDYAPIAYGRAYIKNGALAYRSDLFIGEHLPLTMPRGSARFWVAAYAENEFLSDKSYMLSHVRHTDWFAGCGHRDFVFNLQKAKEVTGTCRIDVPEGKALLVPIAGVEPTQELTVQTADLNRIVYLGKWAFSYFRFDAPAVLHAEKDQPYAVGTPIFLEHSPARKKLVLNILVDGLSWPAAREHFPAYMPRIAKFFERGTIFNQHFSTSEHTYPALPAIETGRYPHHTQVFNTQDSHEIPLDYRTLSECMKALGYYCAAPMTGSDSVHCGAMRGYDRLITTTWKLPAAEACERALCHMEAFQGTDLFLFLHVGDVHPYDAKDFKFSTVVETQLPLAERLFKWNQPTASVRLPDDVIYQQQFWAGLRTVDRSIGHLLSYIERNYPDDAYIVNLYSDHGVSIFSTTDDGMADIIGEYASGATWMMRGAGIPQGVVADELTSIVDIYPTLGALCGFPVDSTIDGNLPAVFGGRARDAVYTASMFPGQTYKLAVRSKTHALRVQTKEVVDEDGTVDFADVIAAIYPRGHEAETGYEMDSADLRAFFYPRARDFVRAVANNGEFWPAMRAARPAWFGQKEGQI